MSRRNSRLSQPILLHQRTEHLVFKRPNPQRRKRRWFVYREDLLHLRPVAK